MTIFQLQVDGNTDGEWTGDFDHLLGVARKRPGVKNRNWQIVRIDNRTKTVIAENKQPTASPASEPVAVASEPEAAPSESKPETPFTTRYGSPVELLGWHEQDVWVKVRYADGGESEAHIADLRAPDGLLQIVRYLNNLKARYLVANNVIDCDPMEFDSPRDALEQLQEYEADGEIMAGYQVMVMRGDELIESLRADNWLYGYSEPAPVADDAIPFAEFDYEPIADSSEPVTMPSENAQDAITGDLASVQVLSTVKAEKNAKTPVMTKKERRKLKQAELRAAYAIAQEKKRIYHEQGAATVFEFSRRMTNINQQMSGVYGTVPSSVLLGKAA